MIYFDNSATTRNKPIVVKLNCIKELYNNANAGRSAHKASIDASIRIEKARNVVQKYFFEGNVIFTKNCTDALNLAILGSNITNQVITTCMEHNSILRPLKQLELSKKIQLKIITPKNNDYFTSIKTALTYNTSMVIISGMSNVNGYCIDVIKIAKYVKENSKAIVMVDMAQAGGHIKYDYANIDIICCSGHKGLYGLQGSGFLLAKNNILLAPIMFGGTGISTLSLTPAVIMPESMEVGTLFTMGITSLASGIKWTFKNFDKLHKLYEKLTKTLVSELSKLSFIELLGGENGVVCFNIKNMPSSDVGDILSQKFHICVRSGLHCAPLMHKMLQTNEFGAVRVSFGKGNSILQIKYLIYALKKIDVANTISNA